MGSSWKKAVLLALFASTACASEGTNGTADASNAGTNVAADAAMPAPTAEANNAAGGDEPSSTPAAGSILAWSIPTAGSTVGAPVNELVFHFTPPARLGEVTVTGPDGAMPMMVTAVGEVEHYSLPLSADTPGAYMVDWRATAKGRDFRGSFGFAIR